MPLFFDSFGVSAPGRDRDANEDSFCTEDPLRLYSVSDGLGGYQAGSVASRTAQESVFRSLRGADPKTEADARSALSAAAHRAHEDIRRRSASDPDLKGMRSTLTLLYFHDTSYYFCNVGDSRGYIVRGGKLYQITRDHTPAFQLVLDGSLQKESLYVHPDAGLLTQSFGSDHAIAPDLFSGRTAKGDVFLLCSDGLPKEVKEPRILHILTHTHLPGTAAQALVDAALKAGGSDDVTVVVVAG